MCELPKEKRETHLQHYQRQEVPQRLLPLKPADQHTSTHTTHQGSAGRWEEHHGERDGRSLARPLSPHHPASPSQQERDLNQRSKTRGREWGTGEGGKKERGQEETDAVWVNERIQRKQGVKKVPWNERLTYSYLVFLAAFYSHGNCFVFVHFFKYWGKVSSSVHWTTFHLGVYVSK